MRMTVAGQEAVEPQHIAIASRANDDGPGEPSLDEPDAAQDQGTHDALAKLGLGDQKRPETLGSNHQGFDRPENVGIHQRRPAGQLSQLTHKRTGLVGNDRHPRSRTRHAGLSRPPRPR